MGTKTEKLLHFVQPRLEDGELVLAMVSGSCDAKVDGDGVRSALLVATDRRVIALSKKLSGCTLDFICYDQVSSLEQGKNLMGHSLAFRALDHHVTLKWIVDLADLAEFAAFVKAKISASHDSALLVPESAGFGTGVPGTGISGLGAVFPGASDSAALAVHPLAVTNSSVDSSALHQLVVLRDSVGLTDDEFEATKAELIARH